MTEIRLLISRQSLVLLQFILEGYERGFSVSTLDPRTAIVQVFIMPDYIEEMMVILNNLKNELDFEWIGV